MKYRAASWTLAGLTALVFATARELTHDPTQSTRYSADESLELLRVGMPSRDNETRTGYQCPFG